MYERAVGERHREVEHHRLFLVLLQIIDEKVAIDIWTELAFIRLAPILRVDVRIPIALAAGRVLRFVAGPHAPVIEAVFGERIGLDSKVVDLPLAGDGRLVAGRFHHAGANVV